MLRNLLDNVLVFGDCCSAVEKLRHLHIMIELTMDRFAEKVIKAAKGEKGIVEPSFVYLPGVEGGDAIAKATGTDFFSVPIELGVSQHEVYKMDHD